MNKKITINVLHLSHTDIGYTDTQARIITNQINYIKEMVETYKETPEKFTNWKWICESFFIVEKFMKSASDEQRKLFNEMVEKKIISLSASYLNLCELASSTLYGNVLKKAKKLSKENNWNLNSAICNDVNGFSYGFGKQLSQQGVEHLYFGLHTHHGMFPCFKKQNPFYWDVGNDKKVLVWVGEHYMMGNELGFADVPFGNYILQSDFENGYFEKQKQLDQAKARIMAYVSKMKKEGYAFDNIPISLLGANTDNAPSNLTVVERIADLNEILKDHNIEIKQTSLEEFFENIKAENKEIETHKGDWPDWWTDGTGSTPKDTRIFKQAQRNLEFIYQNKIDTPLLEELEEMLIMYAEHTWGAWSSIEVPFAFWTQEISAIKSSYAARALAISTEILDGYTKRTIFKLEDKKEINILIDSPIKSDLKISVKLNDYLSSKELANAAKGIKVYQEDKQVKTFTVEKSYMGIPQPEFYAIVDFSKSQKIKLQIKLVEDNKVSITYPTSMRGADKITDSYNPLNNDQIIVNGNTFENNFMKLEWDKNEIISLYSKVSNKELLDPEQEGLFTPIYELGEIPYEKEAMNLHRRWTGRNRKMAKSKRYNGVIKHVEVVSQSQEKTELVFFYTLKGTKYFKLLLEIANDTNSIAVTLHMIKDIEWSMESVYLSLPFAKKESQVLFDKGGMFEIWKDQLPGTLIDYYSIQEGIEVKSDNKTDILISTPDNNLFWTGPLQYQNRFLAHDERNKARPVLYAWLMNNAWETNFNADLSGFHEFRFTLNLPKENKNTINNLKVLNGIYTITRK